MVHIWQWLEKEVQVNFEHDSHFDLNTLILILEQVEHKLVIHHAHDFKIANKMAATEGNNLKVAKSLYDNFIDRTTRASLTFSKVMT